MRKRINPRVSCRHQFLRFSDEDHMDFPQALNLNHWTCLHVQYKNVTD